MLFMLADVIETLIVCRINNKLTIYNNVIYFKHVRVNYMYTYDIKSIRWALIIYLTQH